MPDSVVSTPTDPPRNWLELSERIFDKVLKFLAPFALVYLAYLGNSNRSKIETVESNQVEVKQTLDAKAREDAKATRVQLWNSWKNLEWLAEESGKPTDKAKAVEAKRVYDEWVKLMSEN